MRLEQYVSRFFPPIPPGPATHHDHVCRLSGLAPREVAVYPFFPRAPPLQGAGPAATPRRPWRAHHTALRRPDHRLQLLQFAPSTGPMPSTGENWARCALRRGTTHNLLRIEVRQALQELVTQDEGLVRVPWRRRISPSSPSIGLINKQSEQFRFLFASDVDNFTEFPRVLCWPKTGRKTG